MGNHKNVIFSAQSRESIAVDFIYYHFVNQKIDVSLIEQSFDDHFDWRVGSTDFTATSGKSSKMIT